MFASERRSYRLLALLFANSATVHVHAVAPQLGLEQPRVAEHNAKLSLMRKEAVTLQEDEALHDDDIFGLHVDDVGEGEVEEEVAAVGNASVQTRSRPEVAAGLAEIDETFWPLSAIFDSRRRAPFRRRAPIRRRRTPVVCAYGPCQPKTGSSSCYEGTQVATWQTLSCPAKACRCTAKDCTFKPWNEWSECSETCGGGQKIRHRSKLTEEECCGTCSDETVEQQECNVDPCPVDCVMGDWQEWGNCTATCGKAEQDRFRKVTTKVAHGGLNCTEATNEEQACPNVPCPNLDIRNETTNTTTTTTTTASARACTVAHMLLLFAGALPIVFSQAHW